MQTRRYYYNNSLVFIIFCFAEQWSARLADSVWSLRAVAQKFTRRQWKRKKKEKITNKKTKVGVEQKPYSETQNYEFRRVIVFIVI